MHLGRVITSPGCTVGRVNPSSSAFYQSKGRVDGSLDEPMPLVDNRYLEQFHGPPLSIDTQEQYYLAQVEHVPESLDSYHNGSNCFGVSDDLKCKNT